MVAGGTYLLKPAPDVSMVQVRERPAERSRLRLALLGRTGERATTFVARLVSDWDELVTVRALGEAVPLPVGRYAVEALTVEQADAAGRKWRYQFAGGRGATVEVAAGRQPACAVLKRLRLEVMVEEGADVYVTPSLRTASGLYPVNYETRPRGGEVFDSGSADIQLLGADTKVLDRASSGFR